MLSFSGLITKLIIKITPKIVLPGLYKSLFYSFLWDLAG